MRLWEAFKKAYLLHIVKHIFGFWVRLLISRKVVPFLYINALSLMEPNFEKTRICREIKFVIVVNVFSVSCVCFKEIFSVHYGKCILPTYPEWNIRQTWKLNILWASSKTKSFQMHGTDKFVFDICWETFLQFHFKSDILCFWFI